jgi:hypothetical protein
MAIAVEQARGGIYIAKQDAWSDLYRRLAKYNPKTDLGRIIKQSFKYLPADLAQEMIDALAKTMFMTSNLRLIVDRGPNAILHGGPRHEDYGIVSDQLITTAGVVALCVAWGSAAFNAFYHSLGTSSTGPAIGDVQLTAEITTNHYTGSVRPTGTHAESTNTVVSVATHTQATAGDTIQEHGIATSATPAAVTLWDHHTFTGIALAVSDSLQSTYTLTATAGGE